jgi:hypothetical protein
MLVISLSGWRYVSNKAFLSNLANEIAASLTLVFVEVYLVTPHIPLCDIASKFKGHINLPFLLSCYPIRKLEGLKLLFPFTDKVQDHFDHIVEPVPLSLHSFWDAVIPHKKVGMSFVFLLHERGLESLKEFSRLEDLQLWIELVQLDVDVVSKLLENKLEVFCRSFKFLKLFTRSIQA